ncbi:hypothetical protein DFH07DRAFT_731107 [Mycena maculata]|uniref:CBM1 domain-containing protein n=1 Tax=Mycena maculata TaxID=230809 RepID=A0AAD7K3T4_9AGAR|nr:hypothetical protein DFH07DRAFT_731107 [Mycena maculata]
MISLLFLPIVAFVVPAVIAQSPVYGQCGGIGWTGSTTCSASSTCTFQNPYYSQCLPSSTGPTTSSASTITKTTTSTITTTTSAPPPPAGPVTYWFPFGDSYTTTGFVPNNTLPSVGNPLGNPPFPGDTGGGGENYVGFDTVTYNASTILTYNYAYGGATINSTLVAPYLPTVLSLINQVSEFLEGAGTKPATSPWTSKNSLFSVWIGINDLGNSYSSGGDLGAFNDVLLQQYFEQVELIVRDSFGAGARNFLFINVPPMDRSPLMIANGPASTALLATDIADYNTKLATTVSSFKANNTGVTTWLWDAHTVFTTILNDPTAYGFVDPVSYGNTGDFWANNYHPGPAAHQIFAQDIASLLTGTPWF